MRCPFLNGRRDFGRSFSGRPRQLERLKGRRERKRLDGFDSGSGLYCFRSRRGGLDSLSGRLGDNSGLGCILQEISDIPCNYP